MTAPTANAASSGPVPHAPAPPARRILAQARFEAGTLLRNGEQLLVSLVLPLMALIGLHVSSVPTLGDGRRIDLAVPGVLAMAVISASFTAQAIATGFDRRYNVLRLLGTTPLGRSGLLIGKALATLAVQALQFVVIGAVGMALGWEPQAAGILPAVVFVVAGTWVFVALALLLAGTVRAEGVLALANLAWVLFLVVGGVIVPSDRLPAGAAHVVQLLPSAALADGLRAAFGSGSFRLPALLILLGWGVVATFATSRTFRWGE